MKVWLENRFNLTERGSTVRKELTAGLTTFLTMIYIVIANPQILSDAGMDYGAVFVATCLISALATLGMGLFVNYPIALAPGMGINAFFSFTVVGHLGYDWQVALGAVFLSSVIFVVLSVLPVRRWIVEAIPRGLKLAISAGIGFFLGIISLKNAGIIQGNEITLVTMGDLNTWTPWLSLTGFCVIVVLAARGVPGATLLGILGVTGLGIALGISRWDGSLLALPPDPMPTFLQLDIGGALKLGLIVVILSFLIVDIFDTTGTLIGVSQQAGLLDQQGRLPRMNRAMIVDSTATMAGSLAGTSPVTSYIESASGVAAGGRTGLTSVTVAFLFLGCLFFEPLAKSIPAYATAPAILFVACLMARPLGQLPRDNLTEYAAAIVTVIAIPLTYSISDGIGFGFITYAAVKLLAGRWRECSLVMYILAAVFMGKFLFL